MWNTLKTKRKIMLKMIIRECEKWVHSWIDKFDEYKI